MADDNSEQSFNNGITTSEQQMIDDTYDEITNLIKCIEQLPCHRSYSLCITELESARFWLLDRTHKAASP